MTLAPGIFSDPFLPEFSTKVFSGAGTLWASYWFILCENNLNSPQEQLWSWILASKKGARWGSVSFFFFSGEEILITTKYLSQRQPSECQVSVVINIHYDRNSKNSPFSSGCLCFYLEHQRTSSSSSARLSVYTHTHTDSSHMPLAIRWSYDLVINTSAVTLTWCFPGCKKKTKKQSQLFSIVVWFTEQIDLDLRITLKVHFF